MEVKKLNNSFYVYRSTTIWLKDEKHFERVRVTSIKEQGNALLLDRLFENIRPNLEEGFPSYWREMYALAVLRAIAPTPLSWAEGRWEKLDDVRGLRPDLDPRRLSDILRAVGLDRAGQADLFRRLSVNGEELVYDLSCFFSRSDEVSLAEKGQNKDHMHLPQVNLALLCSAEQGLPTMIRALPGSVRDVATIYASMREVGLENKVLILDRGFFGEEALQFLERRSLSYVLPARRNSPLYEEVGVGEDEFLYHDRLIHFGKARDGERWLYRYEDTQMPWTRRGTWRRWSKEGTLSKQEKLDKMDWAGHVLIVSDLDRGSEGIFQLYKRKDKVEKQFETWKGTLHTDRTWLRDDASVFGHVFMSFLSLYLLARSEQALRDAGLLSRYSARHVLDEYSTAYVVRSGERTLEFEVPKKVRELDRRLGFDLFPKVQS
ncbi:MAG: transposase [Methanomassiliicoccales archaeon]|nr:transposase [Methanomassiliicoccales archaeon]